MRKWGSVLSALVLTLGIGACSSGGSEDGKTTVVWNMWAGDTASEQKLKDQMAAAQAAVGSDITIKLQTAPWNDFFTKLNANMAGGNLACVTAMNGQRLTDYTAAFEPLTDADLATMGISRTDYNPGALSVMESGGKLYGLPYDTATMFLFYNADLFKKAGLALPTNTWTIADFEAAARTITAKTGVKGFAVSLDEFQWLSLPMARSGKQPVDENGKLALTDPAFVEAATWYGNLVTGAKVSDSVPSASETSWEVTQFQNGKAAMIVDGTWQAASYTGADAKFDGGAIRLPAGSAGQFGVVLGSGYGIAKGCKDKQAALKVLGALAGKTGEDVLAKQGDYPAQTASQDAYFASLPDSKRDMLTAAFKAGFQGATAQRVTAEWTQVATAMPTELVTVYTGQSTMGTALGNLQKKFGK